MVYCLQTEIFLGCFWSGYKFRITSTDCQGVLLPLHHCAHNQDLSHLSFLCTSGTNRNAKFDLVWASHAHGFANQKAGRVSQGYILHSELTGVHWILWHWYHREELNMDTWVFGKTIPCLFFSCAGRNKEGREVELKGTQGISKKG